MRFPAKKNAGWRLTKTYRVISAVRHSPPSYRVALGLPSPSPESLRKGVPAYADVTTKFAYPWFAALRPSAAKDLRYKECTALQYPIPQVTRTGHCVSDKLNKLNSVPQP